MERQVRVLMTTGVQELNIHESITRILIDKSLLDYFDKSYFVSFHPEKNRIKVTDGNEKTLDYIDNISIPTKIWFIKDDYGDYDVITFLLPSEY